MKKSKLYYVQASNTEYVEGKEIEATSREHAIMIYRQMWDNGDLRVNRSDLEIVFVSGGQRKPK